MRKAIIFALLIIAVGGARADPARDDRDQVADLLKLAHCVVDGRNALQRKLRPLSGVVIWQRDVGIRPAGPVIVIGDDERQAADIARNIQSRFRAAEIHVLRGGFDAWHQAVASKYGASAIDPVPRNRCAYRSPPGS